MLYSLLLEIHVSLLSDYIGNYTSLGLKAPISWK